MTRFETQRAEILDPGAEILDPGDRRLEPLSEPDLTLWNEDLRPWIPWLRWLR